MIAFLQVYDATPYNPSAARLGSKSHALGNTMLTLTQCLGRALPRLVIWQ
jgi:hypothetical protein